MISKEIGYSPDSPRFYKYDPNKEIYCINFGFQEIENQMYSCYRIISHYKPSLDDAIEQMTNYINSEVTENIVNFVYNGYKIWLTVENQNDFLIAKAAGLTTLTVKAEFEGNTVYIDVELSEFLQAMSNHINSTLNAGRTLKDNLIIELTELFNTYAQTTNQETA